MVIVFMVSRLRRAFTLFAVVAGSGLLTAACSKVPLLAPSGSTITLTAAATALPLNGSAQIIAQVLEAAGTPPQDGTLIVFTTSLGSVQPPQAETKGGRVTVTFNAGTTSGTATITASSGGASASGANAVKIAVGAAAVGSVRVDANPSVISSSGGTSAITASTFDINGNLMASIPVSFATDAGAVAPAVAISDANGKAQTTLTTTKVAKVTATAGISTSSGTGTGATGTSPQSATVTVTVNAAPSITVGSPSPATPSVGQSVTFPLTYTADPNGSPIQNVTVDFGDGSRATTYPGKPASVSHTYTSIGSYSIRATATDALGDTATASGSVNVGALASVTVGTPSPASPSVGQAVTFPLTFSSTSSPIQRVAADFGDGTAAVTYTGTPSSVSHTYTVSGTFAMRVTAFDAFGNTSVGGTSILVGARPQPAVSITTTTTNPTAGTDITFTASVTPATGSGTVIQDVIVDFGDGTRTNLGPVSGTAISVHHVYLVGGTYSVVLSATDSNGGVGTATTTVFVQTATPLTVLLSASAQPAGANTTESFIATVIGLGNSVVVNYHWVFGGANGTADTSSNQQTRSYAAGSGPITVSVTVTTSTGGSATGSTVITP